MTNLTPADQWDGIYQLEENDPVQGGVGGVSNIPLQNLTNRTERIHQSLLDVGIDIVNKVYSNPTTTKNGPVRKATDLEIENGSSVANAFIDPEQFKKYNGVVETIGDLRLREGYGGEIIYLKCHTSNSDGGHGPFRWDASSTAADDNGVTIAVTEVATGRWVRQLNGFVTPEMFGAVGDGITIDSGPLDTMVSVAIATGNIPKPIGTYAIDRKFVIKCPFDGTSMTVNAIGSPAIAIEVSTGSADNPTDILSLSDVADIVLPKVINIDKPVSGWVGQGIGVRYVNVQNATITEQLVKGFAIGVQSTSYTQGCAYNKVNAGFLLNNKINRQITVGDATGFNNRWDYFGGRYFNYSTEGTEVPGVIHLDIVANSVGYVINDHNFFGGSFEGVTQEYHIRSGGSYINVYGGRFESDTPGGIKIHLAYNGIAGQGAIALYGGRGVLSENINLTYDAGASINRCLIQSSAGGNMIATPAASVFKNSAGATNPSIVLYEPSTDQTIADPLVDYSGFLGPQKIGGKRKADAYDRILLDTSNGYIRFGTGSAPATSGFNTQGAAGLKIQGNLYYPNTPAAPSNLPGSAPLWFDEATGHFKFRLPDGTVRTLADS